MSEQQYRVVADRDWEMIQPGDRVTYVEHPNERRELVRIERPVPDGAWRDNQGDVWTEGDDGLMHSFESAPFPRDHVEKKWGPLVPVGSKPSPHPSTREQIAEAQRLVLNQPHDRGCDSLYDDGFGHRNRCDCWQGVVYAVLTLIQNGADCG